MREPVWGRELPRETQRQELGGEEALNAFAYGAINTKGIEIRLVFGAENGASAFGCVANRLFSSNLF